MKNDNNLIIGIIVIVALVLVALFIAAGFSGGYSGMMGYRTYGMMGGYGYPFFGLITWLLVVALIVAAIYWLIKTANR